MTSAWVLRAAGNGQHRRNLGALLVLFVALTSLPLQEDLCSELQIYCDKDANCKHMLEAALWHASC